MQSSRIPRDVSQFILEHIHSVWMLEALLCLIRIPGQSRTAKEIASQLRSNPDAIGSWLSHMVETGIVEKGSGKDSFRVVLDGHARSEALRQLPGLYQVYPNRLINLIYTDRRAETLRSFADAFKIRGGGEEEDR